MNSQGQTKRPIIILSVEDNPADARLIAELFKATRAKIELHFVSDGETAMDFLHRRGSYAKAVRPDLILLDLNLPRKDGREVLREIKESADLCCIPTIIFSTSNAHEDIHRSYQLHANCFYTKPSDLDRFDLTIRSIEENWLSLVSLPDYPDRHRVYA